MRGGRSGLSLPELDTGAPGRRLNESLAEVNTVRFLGRVLFLLLVPGATARTQEGPTEGVRARITLVSWPATL